MFNESIQQFTTKSRNFADDFNGIHNKLLENTKDNKGRIDIAEEKLSGIQEGANKYIHPASHQASMIVQDASRRFVTDAEKTTWNEKETTAGALEKANAALQTSKNYADEKVGDLKEEVAAKTSEIDAAIAEKVLLNGESTNVNFIENEIVKDGLVDNETGLTLSTFRKLNVLNNSDFDIILKFERGTGEENIIWTPSVTYYRFVVLTDNRLYFADNTEANCIKTYVYFNKGEVAFFRITKVGLILTAYKDNVLLCTADLSKLTNEQLQTYYANGIYIGKASTNSLYKNILSYNRILTNQEIQHNFYVLNTTPSIKTINEYAISTDTEHITDSTGKTQEDVNKTLYNQLEELEKQVAQSNDLLCNKLKYNLNAASTNYKYLNLSTSINEVIDVKTNDLITVAYEIWCDEESTLQSNTLDKAFNATWNCGTPVTNLIKTIKNISIRDGYVRFEVEFKSNIDFSVTNTIYSQLSFVPTVLKTGTENTMTIYSSISISGKIYTNFDITPFSSSDFSVFETSKLSVPNQEKYNYLGIPSNRLKGKKILCIGDSITWLDGNTSSGYDGGNTTVIGYQQQFRKCGAIVTNKGHSGATIRKYVDTDDMEHGSLVDDIKNSNYDVSQYDIITIFAGTNDVGRGLRLGTLGNESDSTFDETTTIGALRAMVEYIRGNNPKCEIVIMTPIRSGLASRPYTKMEQVTQGIIDVAKMYSIPCADLLHQGGIGKGNYTIYLFDDIHPNNDGFRLIGERMVRYLNSK